MNNVNLKYPINVLIETKKRRFDAEICVELHNDSEVLEDAVRQIEESSEGYEDMTERCLYKIEPEKIKALQAALDAITDSDTFDVYFEDAKIID